MSNRDLSLLCRTMQEETCPETRVVEASEPQIPDPLPEPGAGAPEAEAPPGGEIVRPREAGDGQEGDTPPIATTQTPDVAEPPVSGPPMAEPPQDARLAGASDEVEPAEPAPEPIEGGHSEPATEEPAVASPELPSEDVDLDASGDPRPDAKDGHERLGASAVVGTGNETPPPPEAATPDQEGDSRESEGFHPPLPLRRPHRPLIPEIASATIVIPRTRVGEGATGGENQGLSGAAAGSAPPGPTPVNELLESIVQAGTSRILREPPVGAPTPAPQTWLHPEPPPPTQARAGLPVESSPPVGAQEWDSDVEESPLVRYRAIQEEIRRRPQTRETRRHPQLEDLVSSCPERPRSVSPPGYSPRQPERPSAPGPSRGREPSPGSRAPLNLKRRGALFGDLSRVPIDPTVDPPPYACFNCWQEGHRRNTCPRPVVARYCYNCGRRGESLATCPRCEQPHRIHMEGRAAAIRISATCQREEPRDEREVDRTPSRGDRAEGIVSEALRALGAMERRGGEQVEVTVVRASIRGRSPTRRPRNA